MEFHLNIPNGLRVTGVNEKFIQWASNSKGKQFRVVVLVYNEKHITVKIHENIPNGKRVME